MVTEGHFSTHFLSDYGSWITSHYRIFYQKLYSEMIDHAIEEKYFQAKFVSESLDFHFYAPSLVHNCNPNYGFLGGLYSNDNNSLDFLWKNTKFVFKFILWMCTFKNIKDVSRNSLPFKSYCRNGDWRSLFNTFSKRLRLVNN